MQIVADVTNLKVEVAGVQEAASYGAALVAGTTTGLIEPDAARPPAGATFEPRHDRTRIYDTLYRVYQEGHR
jgi:sugar (pentulose or hexulose) kinase